MAGIIAAFSAALFIAVSANPATYDKDDRLKIIKAENNVLEATFFAAEAGIRIYGDESSIMISSMSNNEVLMSASTPSESTKYYRVLESHFLEQITINENGERRKSQFILPESFVDQAKEGIRTENEERIISQLAAGKSEMEVQTTQALALQRLLNRQDILLIESAAQALGKADVRGYENQGALNFYGVAMAVARVKRADRNENKFGGETRNKYEMNTSHRSQRSPLDLVHCKYRDTYCLSGSCEMGSSDCNGKCTDWEDCVGMCGPGCSYCWSYVCNDCCYHQGCYDHDMCCGGSWGYLSVWCLIPLPFSCNGYNC